MKKFCRSLLVIKTSFLIIKLIDVNISQINHPTKSQQIMTLQHASNITMIKRKGGILSLKIIQSQPTKKNFTMKLTSLNRNVITIQNIDSIHKTTNLKPAKMIPVRNLSIFAHICMKMKIKNLYQQIQKVAPKK